APGFRIDRNVRLGGSSRSPEGADSMSQEEILPGSHARDERADSPPGSPELGACSGSVAGSVREASSSSLPASVPLPGEAGEARTKHWTAVLLCVGLFLLSAALGMLSP